MRYGWSRVWLRLGLMGLMVASGSSEAFVARPFVPRSQSVNAAREIAGWQKEINQYGRDEFYWSWALIPEYTSSFRDRELGTAVLGARHFNVTGSLYPTRSGGIAPSNRCTTTMLADYFGLPMDYASMVTACPKVQNIMLDSTFFLGFDCLLPGLYFKVHAPLVHTRWGLHVTENIAQAGTAFDPAGYMGPDRINREQLPVNLIQALNGTVTVGDMHQPFLFGKIPCKTLDKTRLSDVQLALGWNFYQCERAHLGINVRGYFPSGNRPCPQFIFSPVVGNGHHYECGGGFSGHVDVWQDDENDRSFGIYLDANITHLFTACQLRSYDFIANGPGSRYMLLEQFASSSTNLVLGPGGDPAPNQYAQQLVPAINATTLKSQISIRFQADVVVKAAWYWDGWNLDLGYNFWHREAEKLHCRTSFVGNTYAIKGDAQVYGFDSISDVATPLGATQHNATLAQGQGATNFVAGSQFANANADSPIAAFPSVGSGFVQLNSADAAALGIAQLPVNTSNPSVLLTDADIHNCSGIAPAASSNKLFAHIGYRFEDTCHDYIPFVGFGSEVEWAEKVCGLATTLSQWGIWFKGGISY